MATGFTGDSAWKPVEIGAGGWITGIDVAPDGTMVARTDTYGAYIWNGTAWTQLVTASSMPGNDFYSAAVYEIRIAPSNSNIFYMEMGDGIYKSVDKGASWTKTSFSVTTALFNGDNRMDGQKMAVDPTNPNIVYAGTQSNGLWVTRDGGTTWSKIVAVPQGTNTNDPSLTGIEIRGSTIYVGTAGSGVYTSTDGGTTWKSIGGPADVANAAISADGSYYAADNSVGALWKYSGGTWTKVISDSVHAVAVDPFDSNHIVVTTPGGSIQLSHDGGATWSGWNYANQLQSSNDIPWLQSSGGYMSSGGLVFDPLVQGKLWQSAGVGVWTTQVPTNLAWNTPVVWDSHSQGIQQLVANDIIAPPGGSPIFASWDRPFFTMSNLDTNATSYSGGQFSAGWSVDYASSSPNFIVGISDWWGGIENSGFSVDGGKTWQTFATMPSFATHEVGGSIAASSTTNIIWVPTGGYAPAYTLDGGKTWHDVTIPGLTNWSQLDTTYSLDRTTITADRVLPNTFYLYDTGSGVYRTTDGGVNWTKMFSGQVADWSYWNAKIEAVPGSAGELFFTSGPQGTDVTKAPGTTAFMHSTDGGASWHAVAGVGATTFGYGAPATAGGPATIYIVGSVNGTFGIWYSADDANTWVQIGERPMGSLDGIKTISGDMGKFGVAYVGFGGSGYAYLDFSNSTATTPVAPPPAPIVDITAPTETISTVLITDVGKTASIVSGGVTKDNSLGLSGTASDAGGLASVHVFDGTTDLGAAIINGGNWSFTTAALANGLHQLTARATDLAGNVTTSTVVSATIDTTAPTASISSTINTNTGSAASIPSGGTTRDNSLGLSGTVGDNNGLASVHVFDGTTDLGAATISGGNWSFTTAALADGLHSFTAHTTDLAGNVTISTIVTAAVDTIAPTELVSVTTASVLSGATSAVTSLAQTTTSMMTTTSSTVSSIVTGTISSPLGASESLVVFRDGSAVGVATVTNGSWTFTDNVASGTHTYSALVQDSAGNFGHLSNAFTIALGNNFIWGTSGSDAIFGTAGDDVISGVPSTGNYLGKGTIDVLTGGAGSDIFVLGDARGRFYDDGMLKSQGTKDFARITDFGSGDKLQLKGASIDYFQHVTTLGRYSGTGIYYDSNHSGAWDSRDELIALVQNHAPVDAGSLIFV